MFLEKHEPATGEEFTWFDEDGNVVDSQELLIATKLSKINRYIIEIKQNKKNHKPPFIKWLLQMGYKIYCISDCNKEVENMTKVQKILFERKKENSKWVPIINQKNIYFKEFKSLEEVELIWNDYLFISQNIIDNFSINKIINEYSIISVEFPNLSFTRLLPVYKELIIGKILWGESYFKPGSDEEPVVLICYTAKKIL